MGSNGERKPPRPRIEMLGSPPPAEAAAVVAALERFLVETAPTAVASEPTSAWQRAALLEGTGAKDSLNSPWGEPRTWGSRLGVRE